MTRPINRSKRHGKTTKEYFTLLIDYTLPMDERYKSVKALIVTGEITEFRQIFKHIPKQVVADDHGTSPKHLTRLMEKPHEITLEEFYEFGESFGVDVDIIINLAKQQLLTKKEHSPNTHKSINHK